MSTPKMNNWSVNENTIVQLIASHKPNRHEKNYQNPLGFFSTLYLLDELGWKIRHIFGGMRSNMHYEVIQT